MENTYFHAGLIRSMKRAALELDKDFCRNVGEITRDVSRSGKWEGLVGVRIYSGIHCPNSLKTYARSPFPRRSCASAKEERRFKAWILVSFLPPSQ